MAKSHLKHFLVGDFGFEHSIDTADDSTSIVNLDDDQRVLRIDSGGKVYDSEDKLIGRFRMDRNYHWVYQGEGSKVSHHFYSDDLLLSERQLLPILLADGTIKVKAEETQ